MRGLIVSMTGILSRIGDVFGCLSGWIGQVLGTN